MLPNQHVSLSQAAYRCSRVWRSLSFILVVNLLNLLMNILIWATLYRIVWMISMPYCSEGTCCCAARLIMYCVTSVNKILPWSWDWCVVTVVITMVVSYYETSIIRLLRISVLPGAKDLDVHTIFPDVPIHSMYLLYVDIFHFSMNLRVVRHCSLTIA